MIESSRIRAWFGLFVLSAGCGAAPAQATLPAPTSAPASAPTTASCAPAENICVEATSRPAPPRLGPLADPRLDSLPSREDAVENVRVLVERLAQTDVHDPARAELLHRQAEAYSLLDAVLGVGPAPGDDRIAALRDQARQRALRCYDELIVAYPDYPRRDAVLYFAAVASERAGDEDAKRDRLETLLRERPESPWAALAHSAFPR